MPRFFAALLFTFILFVGTPALSQELASNGMKMKVKIGGDERGGIEQVYSLNLVAIFGGLEATTYDPIKDEGLKVVADRAVLWHKPGASLSEVFAAVRAGYFEGNVILEFNDLGRSPLRVEAQRIYVDFVHSKLIILDARFQVIPPNNIQKAQKKARKAEIKAAKREAKRRKAEGLPPLTAEEKEQRAKEKKEKEEKEKKERGNQAPTRGVGDEPLYLFAKRLKVFGSIAMSGEDIAVTSCNFGDPHFRLMTKTIKVEADNPYPVAQPGMGGAAVGVDFTGSTDVLRQFLASDKKERDDLSSDRLQGQREMPRWITLKDVYFEVLGAKVFYLPGAVWRSTWDVFPTFGYGNSSTFGNFGTVDLSLPILAPGKKTIGGVRKRHGLSASVQVGAMFSSERGFSESGGMKWKYYHEGRQASRGRFRGTYLRDQGRDRSGLMLERESRGWFFLAQQTELKERWRFDSEVSYLSDRGYLLEFEERIAKTEKQQETYLYTHLREGPFMASALARWRLNDFQDYVERLPELTLDGFSLPLFEDPLLGGGSTLTFGFAGAHIRQRKDNLRRGDPTRTINRVDGQVEIDHKVPLGPFVARGFSQHRFTAVDRSPTRSGGTERFSSAAGVNLATTVWRKFGDKATHVIVPEIGYFNRYFNSRDPTDFFQIDEVDQVRETEFLFLRTRTRLSLLTEDKKRYFDFIDFAVETRYFPKAGKDNNRRNFGSIFSDLRLYYPRIFRARVRVESDAGRGQVITNESSINLFLSAFFKDDNPNIEALQNISIGASYRDLRDVTEALGWNVTWQISKKWSFRLDEQYDFLTSRFVQHRGTFRRRFHRFSLDFSVSIDPGEDDVTFSVQIAPDLFGSNSDPFQNGRLSGIGY